MNNTAINSTFVKDVQSLLGLLFLSSRVNQCFSTELWAETTEEGRHLDWERKHQRNQLVSLTEGELCQTKTWRSKSSCYNQVHHRIVFIYIYYTITQWYSGCLWKYWTKVENTLYVWRVEIIKVTQSNMTADEMHDAVHFWFQSCN